VIHSAVSVLGMAVTSAGDVAIIRALCNVIIAARKGRSCPMFVYFFVCQQFTSHEYHRSDLRESLPEMHLWTKKSLLNFGSPPDLDPSVEIFKLNFGAIRQILLTTQEVFEGCNVVGGGDSYMQQTK